MSPSTARLLLASTLLTVGSARAANAQSTPQHPDIAAALAAVRSCAALGEARRLPEAKAAGIEADARASKLLERDPRNADLLVARARALSQCQLPAADFPGQGELSAQAIELLEQALEIQPTHWTARFVLASIMFRSPAFLGRAPRAAKELDALLAQQGDRNDEPRYARVFEYRGILWQRAGDLTRAGEVWKRGAALFPGDSTLVRLAASVAPPRTSERGAPGAQTTRAAALTAVRVVASSARPADVGAAAVGAIHHARARRCSRRAARRTSFRPFNCSPARRASARGATSTRAAAIRARPRSW